MNNCKKCGKEIPDGLEFCAECEIKNAIDESTPIVSANSKKPFDKKIIIIIAAVILVLGITLAVTFSLSKDKNIGEQSTNGYSNEEESSGDNIVIGGTTAPSQNLPLSPGQTVATTKANQPQTAPATNPNRIDDELKEPEVVMDANIEKTLNAFFNGKFYFVANMYDETGVGTKMELAISGNNLQGILYDSEATMGIMQLDGKTYFFNPISKKYIEFTKEIADTLGLSTDDMNFGTFSSIFGKELDPKNQYYAKINGKDAVCYEFKNEKGKTKFYFMNDKLVEIDQYNEYDVLETEFAVDSFSTSVPSDMLTLNGLSKAKSLLSILS